MTRKRNPVPMEGNPVPMEGNPRKRTREKSGRNGREEKTRRGILQNPGKDDLLLEPRFVIELME